MTYGFIIDNRRCIGCHACTVACKAEHDTPVGVNRTWVKYVEQGAFPDTRRVFTVLRCNHCAEPPCVDICPVTSLFIRPDGIVDFDRDRCIGCKACMQACPYDALHIDPNLGTSSKCNYCAHRIDGGLEPACVVVCPVRAIISGDLDDPASIISTTLRDQRVTVRKPEKQTGPRLFYINGDPAALRPEQAPASDLYLTTEQRAGVGHFAGKVLPFPVPGGNGLGARDGHADGAPPGGSAVSAQPALSGSASPRRVQDIPQRGVLWGWEVTGYLWTKSIATGVLFAPLLLVLGGGLAPDRALGVGLGLVALVFLGLTGLLLIKDLDRPGRFLYVLLRPQWRSWLVRGAYLITAYGACASAWLLVTGLGVGAPAWLSGGIVVLGVLTAVYTAYLLRQAKGRDLWQSPALPVRMVLTAALTGTAAAALLALAAQPAALPPLVAALRALAAVHLLFLVAEVVFPHGAPEARTALGHIRGGSLAVPFWGAVVAGHVAPLAILFIAGAGWGVAAACVLVLLGALASEHAWVRAPQLIPLA